MAILVQFELRPADGNARKVKDFFAEILPATRTFAGNLSTHLYEKDQTQTTLILLEEWTHPERFDAYILWRKDIGDFGRLNAMLTESPAITMLTREV
ncbi:antibiotic biosynthesis monooxygenase family protein [Hahella sp. HN01]|uniref:putative quinol monooxygenase n=1 Tax=Hahella sp. HN01 TaxID=2847262 RepID=UPI001C1EE8DD|nr:antibiotic biosynthesis monooxygenase [Hahella sp. HN01]